MAMQMLTYAKEEGRSTPIMRGRQTVNCVEEALKILNDETMSTQDKLPFRPKGGEVYLFQSQTLKQSNDWRADGHRWHNQGTTKLPRSRPHLAKSYFYLKTSDGTQPLFKRDVFKKLNDIDNARVLIHYIGNEELSIPIPHGNAATQTKLYFRTQPSKMIEIKEKVKTEVSPPQNLQRRGC
jgi:hypothetical protein